MEDQFTPDRRGELDLQPATPAWEEPDMSVQFVVNRDNNSHSSNE